MRVIWRRCGPRGLLWVAAVGRWPRIVRDDYHQVIYYDDIGEFRELAKLGGHQSVRLRPDQIMRATPIMEGAIS